jgi:hypothetical protein
MSRNNQSRLGLDNSPTDDSTSAATTAAVGEVSNGEPSPAFNWSVPTEFVELPSKGVFYPEGHPLQGKTSVEIRFMTAKEEDILTSRTLLKEGIALDRMLQNLIVDPVISVADLLVGDKNALLVAARRTGYGAQYDTRVQCPSCGQTGEHSFDISEPPCKDFVQEADDCGAVLSPGGLVEIILPMSKVMVVCRLLNSAEETKLSQKLDRKMKKKSSTGTTLDAFRAYVSSVNGDDSVFAIESFIHSMPARDARHLRTIYSSIVPNIDLEQHFVCESCGFETEMEVPLGVDFFWPE